MRREGRLDWRALNGNPHIGIFYKEKPQVLQLLLENVKTTRYGLLLLYSFQRLDWRALKFFIHYLITASVHRSPCLQLPLQLIQILVNIFSSKFCSAVRSLHILSSTPNAHLVMDSVLSLGSGRAPPSMLQNNLFFKIYLFLSSEQFPVPHIPLHFIKDTSSPNLYQLSLNFF